MLRSVCILIVLPVFIATTSLGQTTRRVLFLGNSYTGVNNLPQLVKDVASSAGDSLIFDRYTPGGYTLQDHLLDAVSTNKIMIGNWDYVVLQGQSQEPITYTPAFNNGGSQLHKLVKQYNPCAVTMLYMTWGRKNGDAANCPGFPEMCTYQKMDSALKYHYLNLTSFLNAEVSPVSAVWRNLRQNNPGINLYQADESHPSAAGSYAAACSFYAAIFKKDPTFITDNYSLAASDAATIRNAAKLEVYDSLGKWDYKKLPTSDFHYKIGQGMNEVIFTPLTNGTQQNYLWNFGDGDTSSMISPSHTYANNGTYLVQLTTSNCDLQGMHTSVSDTVIQFCGHTPLISTSHPWLCQYDTLWTQPADAYQWFSNGVAIPETLQYLANYQRYNISGFSILSTVNGCSELSQEFHESPQWSGYYFDAALGGDPCQGDTALFVVLNFNGFLNGSETIRWYKNGTLLPLLNDEDTLQITSQGVYECRVIDPTSNCPMDTTSSGQVVFDCGSLNLQENRMNQIVDLYPNPASEFITLKLNKVIGQDEIGIYSPNGVLLKIMDVASATKINISDLANGLYYIRLKNHPETALRFMKE